MMGRIGGRRVSLICINMREFLKLLREIRDLLKADREEKLAEKEEKLRAEKEKLLVEYAIKHNKRQPTGGVWNGREAQDKPINSGGELIPFGISDVEKQILRDFYDGN